MNLKETLDAICAKDQQERMKDSPQLTLGELILKLEAVADKSKKVIYDFAGYAPTRLRSWRGIYAELALGYEAVEPKTVKEILIFRGNAGSDQVSG